MRSMAKRLRRMCAFTLLALSAAPAAAHEPYALLPGHIELEIGPDGNTVILDAPDGLIVIDTGRHTGHSQAILDYVAAAGKPVAAIVNTHWHLDHTNGNVDLMAKFPQARIVATGAAAGAFEGFLANSREDARRYVADPEIDPGVRERAARALEILLHPELMVPADPITAPGPLSIAGRTLEVRLASAAVTESDLWLLVPEEKLAIVGDLVVAQSPFFDTGCEDDWEAALQAIEAAEWEILIPGHGAPMDRAAFGRWHTAFTNFVACGRSDADQYDCAEGWETDAAGFYSEAERMSVRSLSHYYIERLRAPPERRMAYCATS
jgi:glyoxylase-like metal-dependent hydrolase (beta-lactamase superfamily II)